MIFDPIDMLSWPGTRGKPNEDAFAHADRLVAVFDGATNLGDPVLPSDSDAAWIARKGAEGVIRNDVAGLSAQDVLRLTVQSAERDYRAARLRAPSHPYETPYASMMLLRMVPASGNGQIEASMDALWFGDCAALVKPLGAPVFVIGENIAHKNAEADRARAVKSDATLRDPDIIAGLRASRNRLNGGGGSWVFAPDVACAAHARAQRVTLQKDSVVLVASDGFLTLVSDYGRYTPDTLIDAALGKGFKSLFTEIRDIEAADPYGRQYPRFKQSDDATAILLRII